MYEAIHFSLDKCCPVTDLSLGILSINKYLSIYYVQDTVLGAVGDQRNPRGKSFFQGIYNFVEAWLFFVHSKVFPRSLSYK